MLIPSTNTKFTFFPHFTGFPLNIEALSRFFLIEMSKWPLLLSKFRTGSNKIRWVFQPIKGHLERSDNPFNEYGSHEKPIVPPRIHVGFWWCGMPLCPQNLSVLYNIWIKHIVLNIWHMYLRLINVHVDTFPFRHMNVSCVNTSVQIHTFTTMWYNHLPYF